MKTGGGISESTTALNVDQLNTTSVIPNVDQKNAGLVVPLQVPQIPLVASPNTGKSDLTSTTEAGNIAAAAAAVPSMQKKEVVVLAAKVAAEKKRIDARKKSLKRL